MEETMSLLRDMDLQRDRIEEKLEDLMAKKGELERKIEAAKKMIQEKIN